jgi:nucleoside-diphosphate-sugar epimerase
MPALTNVAVIGANGNLGKPILEALLAAGDFTVTVLKRQGSKSVPSQDTSVRVVEVDDEMSLASLTEALSGQDAVVATFPVKQVEQHLRVADAAAAAGVRRLIPADFGSCDASSPRVQELMPLFKRKIQVRERAQELAASNPQFSWTCLVSGHFFDWGLEKNFLHCDLKTRTIDVLDDGTARTSMTTLPRIAQAVVCVLRRAGEGDEDPSRNRVIFFQSFCVSQLEVLAALEKATASKWTVNYFDSNDFIRENKAKADAGDHEATENLVFAVGAVDGDWEKKPEFDMKLLGFGNEDLDEVVANVVKRNS